MDTSQRSWINKLKKKLNIPTTTASGRVWTPEARQVVWILYPSRGGMAATQGNQRPSFSYELMALSDEPETKPADVGGLPDGEKRKSEN